MKMKNFVLFVKQKIENRYVKNKKYCKVRDHCHFTGKNRSAAHSICNLKYSVPKKTPIPFHNGSNYDDQFIIKELGEEFKKAITCLGENNEKYITLTVPIEKEVTRTVKNGEKIKKIYILLISYWKYILELFDSTRLMARSLSSLANNLSEGIHKIKCKYGHDIWNVEFKKMLKIWN